MTEAPKPGAEQQPKVTAAERIKKMRQRIETQQDRILKQQERLQKQQALIGDLKSRLGKTGEAGTLVERFHQLYYDAAEVRGTWLDTYWFGTRIWKCPLDMWIYQEMLFETRPDFILETGTALGGSALFLAHMCDILGKGEVVTVDVKGWPQMPEHPRITYLRGSSTSEEVLSEVSRIVGDDSAMVVLDSDHSKDHVLDELRAYSPFVQENGYLVVEDTNVNGHPVQPDYGPGPMEAVEEFLGERRDFSSDETREKFFMTFNPGGFLKRNGST